jgi:hypothetical protein
MDQSHYYTKCLAFRSRNFTILKVLKNCTQPFELWHKMPKCRIGTKQPFCRGNFCICESMDQSHYYMKCLAFRSRNCYISKVFLNCVQAFELWHRMPTCQIRIEQHFSRAFTALGNKWISDIVIIEVWHLDQRILLY